jgi:hypothetical protein
MLALVKESVTQAVFSFLAVLDGVAALPEENDTATLQLFHVNADDRTLLNGNEEELHNIFNRIATTTIVKPQAKLRAYETGSARALLRKSVPGDGLEIHHVPNKSFGTKGIHGYDPGTAPAIALPKQDHRRIR